MKDLLRSAFLRYAGAGALGTVLHYMALTLLVELAGIRPSFGTVAGAFVGALTNYLLNYHLTFNSTSKHSATFPRFTIVATLGALTNGLLMWVLAEKIGMHYIVSQVFCTIAVLVIGFVLNKNWTFRETSSAP